MTYLSNAYPTLSFLPVVQKPHVLIEVDDSMDDVSRARRADGELGVTKGARTTAREAVILDATMNKLTNLTHGDDAHRTDDLCETAVWEILDDDRSS